MYAVPSLGKGSRDGTVLPTIPADPPAPSSVCCSGNRGLRKRTRAHGKKQEG